MGLLRTSVLGGSALPQLTQDCLEPADSDLPACGAVLTFLVTKELWAVLFFADLPA